MQTPLKTVRGLGSAGDGTSHFWQQRFTAIANVPLIIFFVWFVISSAAASHAEVVAMIQSPLIAIGLIAAISSVCWHMRLGMQIVIEDYIHGHGLKISAVIANNIFTIGIYLICLFSILKISFAE